MQGKKGEHKEMVNSMLFGFYFPTDSRGGRGTKMYVYLPCCPYRGKISFYVYIVPLGLINIFLHVERDKISCGLQPTRFSRNFL